MMPLKITLSKRKRGLKRKKKTIQREKKWHRRKMQLTSNDWECPKTTGNGRVIKGSQLTLELALKLVTMKEF